MTLDHDVDTTHSSDPIALARRRRMVADLALTWRRARSGEQVEALRRYTYAAGDHRLEVGQVRALEAIEAMGTCRLRELASRLGVQPSSASRVVTRLADKGLVDRVGSADDRRTVQISATAAGREMLEYFWRRGTDAHVEILAGYGDDEILELTAALEQLLDATATFGRRHRA